MKQGKKQTINTDKAYYRRVTNLCVAGEKGPAVKSNLETIIFDGIWPNTIKK